MFNQNTIEFFDEIVVSKRKRKKNKERTSTQTGHNTGLRLKNILPLTETQQELFDSFNEFDNHLLVGSAGTGKTFLSIYFTLKKIIQKNEQKKLMIIRSAASSRDIGLSLIHI